MGFCEFQTKAATCHSLGPFFSTVVNDWDVLQEVSKVKGSWWQILILDGFSLWGWYSERIKREDLFWAKLYSSWLCGKVHIEVFCNNMNMIVIFWIFFFQLCRLASSMLFHEHLRYLICQLNFPGKTCWSYYCFQWCYVLQNLLYCICLLLIREALKKNPLIIYSI